MPRLRLLCCALFTAGLLGFGSFADAQDADAKNVDFTSADKVKLRGKFYAGKNGKNSPTVLMLHALGEDSSKADWVALAAELHKRGYAVLTFDFRGHGDSTAVEPGIPNPNPVQRKAGFWDEAENVKYYKGFVANKRKEEIDFKNFQPAYYRCLVNDIAAAKQFLDEQNDAGHCNSGALIVLGAKDGGSLGAIWMNSEWHRYKFTQNNPKVPTAGTADKDSEGPAIAGAVFLSLSDMLGANKLNMPDTLKAPTRDSTAPIGFFYGELDEKGKKVATACEKVLKNKNASLGKVSIPKTDASGRLLLSPTLGTTTAVGDYLDSITQNKTFPHKNRAAKDEVYIWMWPTTGTPSRYFARPRGSPNIVFFNYSPFIKYAQ